MIHDVVVPGAGESVSEVFIGNWHKKNGDVVKKDDVLVDIETQKATFELMAEHGGRLEILKPQRDTVVKPGDVIGRLDDSVSGQAENKSYKQPQSGVEGEAPRALPVEGATRAPMMSPAARKMAMEKNIEPSAISGTGKKGMILKEDLLAKEPVKEPPRTPTIEPVIPVQPIDTARGEKRQPASRIRRQIAQNLVAAQHTAAILTTFNEADMTSMIAFRNKQKTKPGFVACFALACIRALKEFPTVNATFTGDEIITRDFVDLSIAMSTDRGLVVPVIRDADRMSLFQIEQQISTLAERARAGKLSIQEMTGGTFTITNGGIFGSLVSTPILNMPQSAILGMHKTQDRPVVVDGEIVIRPMMYLALSYDHRLIDGREAVLFLVKIKEGIENFELVAGETRT